MKWKVTVQRTCWEEADFVVDASDEYEATTQAIAAAGDYEFGSGNAEYEVQIAEELGD